MVVKEEKENERERTKQKMKEMWRRRRRGRGKRRRRGSHDKIRIIRENRLKIDFVMAAKKLRKQSMNVRRRIQAEFHSCKEGKSQNKDGNRERKTENTKHKHKLANLFHSAAFEKRLKKDRSANPCQIERVNQLALP
jgi:hypothetical protein